MGYGIPSRLSLEAYVTPKQRSLLDHIAGFVGKVAEEDYSYRDAVDYFEKQGKVLNGYLEELTGLRFSVSVITRNNAYASIPLLVNINHDFDYTWDGGDIYEKLNKETKDWMASSQEFFTTPLTFDYDTFKFSGKTPEKAVHELGIGYPMLKNPRYLLGTILHEIGHVIFNHLMQADALDTSFVLKLATNNLVDGNRTREHDLAKILMGRLDEKKYPELYKKLASGEAEPGEYVRAAMIGGGQRTTHLLNNTTGRIKRSEQFADYYATHFGCPISPQFLDPRVTSSTVLGGIINAVRITFCLGVPFGLPMVAGMISIIDNNESLYDNGVERASKALNGLIRYLRDNHGDLPVNEVKRSIAEIEKQLKKVRSARAVDNFIRNSSILVGGAGRARAYEERLERLVNNPLFLSAIKAELI